MLIELSVSNFYSFRERQTFSMVAAPRMKKKGNTFKPKVIGENLPDLLKVAAIYGPNASGKTNLMKAFRLLFELVRFDAGADWSSLPVKPFRFDSELINKPSSIEVHFIENGLRYQFEVSATAERIVSECLMSYPKGKECLLYRRQHTENGEEYTFGDDLEGGKDVHETWRKLTGPKSLFIKQAVANSSEDLKQLRAPLRWMSWGMVCIGSDLKSWAKHSQTVLKKAPNTTGILTSFLRQIDVPITDIRFDPIDDSNISNDLDRKENIKLIGEEPAFSRAQSKITLVHKTALGAADFAFNEESDGTKNLIGFWLPWTVLGSPHDEGSLVLSVDELDSSLHPLIVAKLVEQHLRQDNPTQMIFTTHDTHLMDTKLLRRDQFWLTERDTNGATVLRSVHDFEGREGEDIEKRYYEGRYRSLPFVRKS